MLLLAGIVFALNSCGRCDGCSETSGIAFYNFTKAEMDSVVVKEYVAGSNFTAVKDSFHASLAANTDTAPYVMFVGLPNNNQTPGVDLLVYLPADSLTYKITGITTTPAHCSRCPEIQLFNFNSWQVNGIKDSTIYNAHSGYGGYLSISK